MPEVGEEGQIKLLDAKVLLIGAGGLGSPTAMYLAAAGIGTLGIVDGDTVDMSNLQRQLLHTEDAVGTLKVDSAEIRLRGINSDITINKYPYRIDSSNVMDLFAQYDIVVDGCDNFPTRYLVNDACYMLNKPNVHGSIFRFDGQITVFKPNDGPCYRCLYPEPPPPGMAPSCAEAGVLGILPGIVGVAQAIETIKLILGIGEPLVGKLLTFDALAMTFRKLNIRADHECPLCGDSPTVTELIDYEQFCSFDG
jgi:molybdopterin/thiamine biosynthesis adenylyltransferase